MLPILTSFYQESTTFSKDFGYKLWTATGFYLDTILT